MREALTRANAEAQFAVYHAEPHSDFTLASWHFHWPFHIFGKKEQSYSDKPLPQLTPQMKLPDHYPRITEMVIGPSKDEHDSINDSFAGANKSLHAQWFRVTDKKSNDAIIAAKHGGADVQIIEDRRSMSSASSKRVLDLLRKGGVEPTLSSSGFQITHSKAARIVDEDGTRVIIGSINLTNEKARDIELTTDDPGIARSFEEVFQTDLKNAATGGTATPKNLDPAFVVSPVNAEDKIAGLIYSVDPDRNKGWVIATSENWGDPIIQKALVDVAARGIPVRVIGPECDQNFNPVINYPHLKDLEAGGVKARMMPKPGKGDKSHPYMHLKMVEVMTPKGPVGYVGSINFSLQSAYEQGGAVPKKPKLTNRELGILFNDEKVLKTIKDQVFDSDWRNSIDMPSSPPTVCRKPKQK
jgi:phosphatidylserine/phosphatidylglycerophosphate/cardiolipin synthase-like enzyme